MKSFVFSILIALSFNAHSVITEGQLLSAISCNTKIENNYWTAELKKQYGEPVRVEQGALWFKATGSLYGSPLKEVFVSASPEWRFVGIILESKPDAILPAVHASLRFPTKTFPSNGHWIGSDGRNIMWHDGKYTKMFCTVANTKGAYHGN